MTEEGEESQNVSSSEEDSGSAEKLNAGEYIFLDVLAVF